MVLLGFIIIIIIIAIFIVHMQYPVVKAKIKYYVFLVYKIYHTYMQELKESMCGLQIENKSWIGEVEKLKVGSAYIIITM